MSDYPNPCDGCDKAACKYQKCPQYLKRFRTMWKQFNSYPVRRYRAMKRMKREKYIYEHPDMIRQYLKNGPCAKCKAAGECDTPCPAYWRWWDARMEWLKWRMGL